MTGLESERLTAQDERSLLIELADSRRKLIDHATHCPVSCEQLGDDAIDSMMRSCRCALIDEESNEAVLVQIRCRYLELRNRIALGNIGLVSFAASRYRGRGVSYQDLFQEGFCGLLEAVDRFDPSNGNRLGAYAIWWIRQRLQRAIATGAFPVRLNRRCLRILAQRGRARAFCEASGPGAVVEPNQALDRYILAATRTVAALDTTCDGRFHPTSAAGDQSARTGGNPDVDFEKLLKVIGSLQPREQEVLALRFGLGGGEQHSLSEAGQRLGVSLERVRQIQEKALNQLRARLVGHDDASLPRCGTAPRVGTTARKTTRGRPQLLRVTGRRSCADH
jgi:RNA polymerase primary sigma factor